MPEKKPQRLTYLITGLQYGGANTGMARLLSELDPEEFDITVVAVADTPPDVVSLLPNHVEVKHLKVDSGNVFRGLEQIIKTLRPADILVCSLFHATAVGIPLGKLLRVPLIMVWQHSTAYSSRFRSLYYRLAHRIADRVLADSQATKRFLRDLGVPDNKISILPIAGVDTDVYKPTNQSRNGECIKVATVGRITPEKGYDDLLECARTLKSFEFEIAGDGSKRTELQEVAPENVTFHGPVPSEQIPDFLNRSEIYFQPSRNEGLCMTVIEAMACGLPVVASAVGGISESVVDKKTGFLCDSGDIDCFNQHIRKLGRDDELRAEMGEMGRERITSHYSRSELRKQFYLAIEQCNR